MGKAITHTGSSGKSFTVRLKRISDRVGFELRLVNKDVINMKLGPYSIDYDEVIRWLRELDSDAFEIWKWRQRSGEGAWPDTDIRWLLPGVGVSIELWGPGNLAAEFVWRIAGETIAGDPYTQSKTGILFHVVTNQDEPEAFVRQVVGELWRLLGVNEPSRESYAESDLDWPLLSNMSETFDWFSMRQPGVSGITADARTGLR